jgi:modulator of FtsH protease HflC
MTQKRDEITNRIRDEVASEAKALGVVVTDVRILRAELPAETSQAIYDRMTSERVREAKELRAQGFEAAQEIRSKADRDRAVLLSDAQRASQTDRGAADAEANSIAVSAYGRDSEFFDLYRTLQVYRSALTQGAPVLVLTPSSELMKFFDTGPSARKTTPALSPPSANGEKP